MTDQQKPNPMFRELPAIDRLIAVTTNACVDLSKVQVSSVDEAGKDLEALLQPETMDTCRELLIERLGVSPHWKSKYIWMANEIRLYVAATEQSLKDAYQNKNDLTDEERQYRLDTEIFELRKNFGLAAKYLANILLAEEVADLASQNSFGIQLNIPKPNIPIDPKIFNNLRYGFPLTAITIDPAEWSQVFDFEAFGSDPHVVVRIDQSRRYPGLFMEHYKNARSSIYNIDRYRYAVPEELGGIVTLGTQFCSNVSKIERLNTPINPDDLKGHIVTLEPDYTTADSVHGTLVAMSTMGRTNLNEVIFRSIITYYENVFYKDFANALLKAGYVDSPALSIIIKGSLEFGREFLKGLHDATIKLSDTSPEYFNLMSFLEIMVDIYDTTEEDVVSHDPDGVQPVMLEDHIRHRLLATLHEI